MKPGFIIVVVIGIFLAWALVSTTGDSLSNLRDRDRSSDSSAPKISLRSNSDRTSSRNKEKVIEPGYSLFSQSVSLKRARATKEKPWEEYLEIRADKKNKSSVDITGWTLRSTESGHRITVGTVAKLPVYPGYNSQNNNVVLEPGDKAYIVSGKSPVRMSFRTNSCTGYFAQNKTFTPRLSGRCPDPEDEDLERFGLDNDPPDDSRDEQCLRAIKRVGSCERAGESDDELSRTCKKYLDRIDYNFCAKWHVTDKDFAGDEWYVYVGSKFNDIWDDDDDNIELRDKQKLLVDVVSY